MLVEIKVALNFLLSFLYDKLPRRRVNLFGEELEKLLKLKINFNTNAQILCSIKLNKLSNSIDPCLSAAAKESAMDLNEIIECLPNYLKLYLLHGKVCYRLCNGACLSDGGNNTGCKVCVNNGACDIDDENDELLNEEDVKVIYAKPDDLEEQQMFSKAARPAKTNVFFNKNQLSNPQNGSLLLRTVSPISSDPWSSSSSSASSSTSSSTSSFYSSLNLKLNKSYNDCLNENNASKPSSPLSASISLANTPCLTSPASSTSTDCLEQQQQQQNGKQLLKPPNSVFTTASFAQTKFGSTKSKNYVKVKQQKMLPNEFSAYIKQKAQLKFGDTNSNAAYSMFNENENFYKNKGMYHNIQFIIM
jgi:hypothetical protein